MKLLSTEKELNKLKEMYSLDISYTIMCKELNVSDRTLIRRLKETGIHIPKKTCSRRKCKYSLNSNYFENINTEDKAYFLGFIGADGCVMKDKFNRLYLKFHQHEQDIDILEKFLFYLNSNHPIKRDKNKPHILSLSISDKKLISDLIKHGITFRKSLTYQFNDNIPQHLIPHYIRGYIDGDGCIFESKFLHEAYHIIGSCKFIDGLNKYLKQNKICINSYTANKGNNKQITINSSENANSFYELIYRNCKITGLRKYEKAKKHH